MTRENKSIIGASLFAVGVAALVLVTVVLPAEYGVDPLGSGARLGLLGMAETPERAWVVSDRPLIRDQRAFQLAPFESIELKYSLRQRDSLVFVWRADGELVFDLHAEPSSAPKGYAESFGAGRSISSGGAYVAPFAGIHGWFFENRGSATVVLEIEVVGFADEVVEYRGGYPDRFRLSSEP